jgi:hypothetical protein
VGFLFRHFVNNCFVAVSLKIVLTGCRDAIYTVDEVQ